MKPAKYTVEKYRDIENGKPVSRFNIIANNGKQVAKANTPTSAADICRGLELVHAEKRRRVNHYR